MRLIMIKAHNGVDYAINPNQIEYIVEGRTPPGAPAEEACTEITFSSGMKLYTDEPIDEINSKIYSFTIGTVN